MDQRMTRAEWEREAARKRQGQSEPVLYYAIVVLTIIGLVRVCEILAGLIA